MGSLDDHSYLLPSPDSPRGTTSTESVWSKFSSPYDAPQGPGHHRSLSIEARVLGCRRSFPPVSPRASRSTSLPRRTASCLKDRILNLSSLTSNFKARPPSGNVLGPRSTSGKSDNNGKGMKKERRISRSVEVLDGGLEPLTPGCWGSRTKLRVMSKSTEELEYVKARFAAELEQMRLCGASKSKVSGNLRLDASEPSWDIDDAERQSCIYSQDQVQSCTPRESRAKNSCQDDSGLTNETGSFCKPVNSPWKICKLYYDDGETLETVDNDDIEDYKMSDAGQDTVFVVTADGDHPPITVRPGVALETLASSPRSHAPNRSIFCEIKSMEGTLPSFSDAPEHSTKPSAAIGHWIKEYKTAFQSVPQMSHLNPRKYKNTGGIRKPDERRTLTPYQHSLLETYPERLYPGEAVYSPRCCGTEDEITVKSTTVQTREFPWHQTNASLRCCLVRSPTSLRSRSEERTLSSLQRSFSEKRQVYRHSAESSVDPRYQTQVVVSEDESGICHGLIIDGTSGARTGVFPASLVTRGEPNVGGMGGRGKPAPTVKKVAPPTVPDNPPVTHRHSGSSFSSGVYSGGDQRSSYSSSLSDENPPPSPRSPARGGDSCDHGQLGRMGTCTTTTTTTTTTTDGGGGGGGGGQVVGSTSPSHYQTQQFTFPAVPHQQQVPQFVHLMCSKTSPGSPHHLPPDSTYAYLSYQHQTSLEDQGIDVQSPGRSSPGSGSGSSTTGSTASSGGCRNSTTSLDSGRASATTHSHQHRLSGQSYDSGSILRHSYHSSSSSLGSLEHENGPHVNVHELLNNGVRDSEVLRAWLTDMRFEEYYDKFMAAGYDMPTISRMTPEDLNAIGITKPAHRKKLKAEITRLNISDGLPDFIPGRLEDWLGLLRLEEYTASLKQQKYISVEQMTQLTWEDLEDIGITKLGHQKKVMLAIKRVKDILSGKKFSSATDPRQTTVYAPHDMLIPREPSEGREQFSGMPEFRTFPGAGHYNGPECNRVSGFPETGVHFGVTAHYNPNLQYGTMQPPPQAHVHPMPQVKNQFHQSGHVAPQNQSPPGPIPTVPQGQVQYRPDVVTVQVRPGVRGRSIESLEEPIYGTYQTFHPEARLPHIPGPMSLGNLPPRPFPMPINPCQPQRSMDDGDITPTNEFVTSYEGGGTLPRPRTANKLRPIAKVTAKTRVDVHEVPQFIKDGMNLKKPGNAEDASLKALNRQNAEKSYAASQGSGSSSSTPQGTPKKVPPPPPRRSNSISEAVKDTAPQDGQYGYLRRGLSYGYMGIKNNLQPDLTPDLPPPPAPPDSANHQHLPDDFPPPPPPLTCVTVASTARITASSTITTSSMTSDSLTTSQTSTTSADDDGSAGFLPRRNDSSASFKSTSSTDSESLPFANENAGTIKQRACRPHPSLAVLDARSSPHSSPRASPAPRRKEQPPQLRQNPLGVVDGPVASLAKSNSSSPDGTGDVLSDIGNMLANLTDELDAMLEQEVILKN